MKSKKGESFFENQRNQQSLLLSNTQISGQGADGEEAFSVHKIAEEHRAAIDSREA